MYVKMYGYKLFLILKLNILETVIIYFMHSIISGQIKVKPEIYRIIFEENSEICNKTYKRTICFLF